jgi:hypothetical protein
MNLKKTISNLRRQLYNVRPPFFFLNVGDYKCIHGRHLSRDRTLQQFREVLPGGHGYRYVIHDRDSIFSQQLDRSVKENWREIGGWFGFARKFLGNAAEDAVP